MSNMLGPAVGYTDLLDFEITEKLKGEARDKFFPLRPSSAGQCGRRLAYDLMQYYGYAKYEQEQQEPNVYRLLNLGHSVEWSALRNFELLMGFKLKYKQQVVSIDKLKPVADEEAPLIEGSMDVVLWSDKFKCVLDVKSQKDGWSVAYKSRWDETMDKYNQMKSLKRIGDAAWYADSLDALVDELGDDFLVDNLLQLNLYATSNFAVERGIDHGVIYKYNKNTSQHYEIRFRPSFTLKQKVVDKFQAIYNAVVGHKDPTLVKRDCQLGSMRCAFCPYKEKCWDQDALKAWFKTLPRKKWATKSREVPGAEQLFLQYEALNPKLAERDLLEEQIIALLAGQEVTKIKLDNGNVYDLKYLKSPKEHFELRRGKE